MAASLAASFATGFFLATGSVGLAGSGAPVVAGWLTFISFLTHPKTPRRRAGLSVIGGTAALASKRLASDLR